MIDTSSITTEQITNVYALPGSQDSTTLIDTTVPETTTTTTTLAPETDVFANIYNNLGTIRIYCEDANGETYVDFAAGDNQRQQVCTNVATATITYELLETAETQWCEIAGQSRNPGVCVDTGDGAFTTCTLSQDVDIDITCTVPESEATTTTTTTTAAASTVVPTTTASITTTAQTDATYSQLAVNTKCCHADDQCATEARPTPGKVEDTDANGCATVCSQTDGCNHFSLKGSLCILCNTVPTSTWSGSTTYQMAYYSTTSTTSTTTTTATPETTTSSPETTATSNCLSLTSDQLKIECLQDRINHYLHHNDQ